MGMRVRPVALAAGLLSVGLEIAGAQDVLNVTARPFSEILVEQTLRAPAVVVAANASVLSAELAGVIDRVALDVGREAQAGEVLVALDPRDYQLALEQAQATLAAIDARIAQAELRLERARRLAEDRYVSDDDLLARETDLAVLEAERQGQQVAIRQARRSLEKTTIEAPFAGAVTDRSAQVGGYVLPGTPLLTLVQTSDPEVEAEIDPRHAGNLDAAAGLRFVSRGRSWSVAPVALSPVIDAGSRVQRLRLRFRDPAAPIGASGELVWTAASGLVPVDLIVRRDGRFGLFVVEDDHARFVPLPEAQEGRPATADLEAGTLVVVGGRERLQDGDPVTVTPAR